MAIGWLTVLKMVPWGDVISNAPKVAEAAKKLWRAAAAKPATAMSQREPGLMTNAPSLAQLQTQLNATVAEITELHQQMLASSELIQTLADQNAQLIARVELNRVRVLVLGGVVAVLIFTVIGLAITLLA